MNAIFSKVVAIQMLSDGSPGESAIREKGYCKVLASVQQDGFERVDRGLLTTRITHINTI